MWIREAQVSGRMKICEKDSVRHCCLKMKEGPQARELRQPLALGSPWNRSPPRSRREGTQAGPHHHCSPGRPIWDF